ncbi:hypothetical protein PVAR5_8617 [Paecilomyces variotii No. 5]|uniref:Hydrophobin n=1 Tax=Byssochlamys spectabilis (strain No. 5 / NBRC 109023) TaxID=1356009 RepID=V5FPE5_BYSSN|nr:hypothetical protein PVAR5_8617 [Paecilomyces variotii No. 5]
MRFGSTLAVSLLGSVPVLASAVKDVAKRGYDACPAPDSPVKVVKVVVVDPVYISTYCETNTVLTIYSDITYSVTNAPTTVIVNTYATSTTTVTTTETDTETVVDAPTPVVPVSSTPVVQWTQTAIGTTYPASSATPVSSSIPPPESTSIRFPVNKTITVQEAQTKCGDQATLSCCNKATYTGNTTNENSGILGGALSNLLGGGSGEGLGLFDQCSKLPLDLNVIGVGVQDALDSQCKQNVACCQNSNSENNGLIAVGLPCIALGSIL